MFRFGTIFISKNSVKAPSNSTNFRVGMVGNFKSLQSWQYLSPQKNLALDRNPLGTDGNSAPTGNWHILTTVVATASYWDRNFLDMKDHVSSLAGTSQLRNRECFLYFNTLQNRKENTFFISLALMNIIP